MLGNELGLAIGGEMAVTGVSVLGRGLGASAIGGCDCSVGALGLAGAAGNTDWSGAGNEGAGADGSTTRPGLSLGAAGGSGG